MKRTRLRILDEDGRRLSSGTVGEVAMRSPRTRHDDVTPWHNVPGALTDISAAADGTVWGVNANAEIYRYTGDQP